MNGDSPATTPPAHVRTVTLEAHEAEIRQLQNQRAEDYEHLRSIGSRLDANHIATMHELGQLARLIQELREARK